MEDHTGTNGPMLLILPTYQVQLLREKRPEHEQGNSSDSLDSFKEVGVSLAISRYSMKLAHTGAMVEVAP